MGDRLEGKVCVITGAGGGMGREAAVVFSAEGARVCVADVDLAIAEETVSLCSGDAFAVRVNVADEENVRAMFEATNERYGGIDVLYNNAGISPGDDASVLDTTIEAWQRVQDVNTKGVFLCCKHGIPYLLKRGGGSESTSRRSWRSRCRDVPDLVHGLEGRRALDEPRARRSVRATGRPRQRALPGAGRDAAPPRDLRRRPGRVRPASGALADRTAREATEIVNAALFLASDESSFVNGAAFVVDGGLTAAYVTPE